MSDKLNNTGLNKQNAPIKMNLQLFAEDEPEVKTFSEDYVKDLREEAKANRIARKVAEESSQTLKEATNADLIKIKAFFGLKPEDELNDAKMELFKDSLISKADTKLVLAEIKSLDGYDHKLVERLLDKSKLTISDDGVITGLKEAVEALAVEFPLIKSGANTGGGTNPPLPTPNEVEDTRTKYAAALKAGKTAEAIAYKNKLFALEHKK